jgi:hypothetical protein
METSGDISYCYLLLAPTNDMHSKYHLDLSFRCCLLCNLRRDWTVAFAAWLLPWWSKSKRVERKQELCGRVNLTFLFGRKVL